MTGPSRTAFHAVPCVLTKPVSTAPDDIGTCPLVLTEELNTSVKENPCDHEPLDRTSQHVWKNEMSDVDSWKAFSEYIKSTRININIRQVHKHKR